MRITVLLYITESHIGVSWKLKNEIPNAHILDQVCLLYIHYVHCYIMYSLSHYVRGQTYHALQAVTLLL